MAARTRVATVRRALWPRAGTTARRILSALAMIAFVAAWALLLRPTALGGPATYIVVSGTSMEPSLGSGDLVVLRDRQSYGVGDVVTYRVPEGTPGAGQLVIHRVTGGSASGGFVTQGDNRDEADEWMPTADDIAGSQWFTVPGLGALLARLTDPSLVAALAGGVAVVVVMMRGPADRGGSVR